jgi:hypothetical protein
MTPQFVDSRDRRIRAAKAFAEEFNQFEWRYLCSYQWFLTAIDRALETGDFLSIRLRAEAALIAGKLRRQTSTVSMSGCVHGSPWWANHYS